MIPFKYDRINTLLDKNKYIANYELNKVKDKSASILVQALAASTEKDGVDLNLIKLDKLFVPIWSSEFDDTKDFHVLVDNDCKNIMTLDDFTRNDVTNRAAFVRKCKSMDLQMLELRKAAVKAKKSSGKLGKLGFDPDTVDNIWRKEVYDHQKLEPAEIKQIADACHKLVDMAAAKKDIDLLGMEVYYKMAKALDVLE